MKGKSQNKEVNKQNSLFWVWHGDEGGRSSGDASVKELLGDLRQLRLGYGRVGGGRGDYSAGSGGGDRVKGQVFGGGGSSGDKSGC